MTSKLTAHTPRGANLVEMAELHAADFRERVAQHDREASYPHENIAALRDSRYLYSPFPRTAGGLEVDSVHDVVVAASRLAEGDPSTTIGSNMHLIAMMGLKRIHATASASGKDRAAAAAEAAMARMAGEGEIYSAAVSEPNQDLTRPASTATRAEGGWVINGMKIFGTMGPAATHFNVAVTYIDDDGAERYGFAQVPASAPGVFVNDDWDALGMRASGSGSIVFRDVRIPAGAMGKGFPAGVITAELLENFLVSGPMHSASTLGIAESAMGEVQQIAAGKKIASHGRPPGERPVLQVFAAEMMITLSAMRGSLDRAARTIDEYYARNPTSRGSLDEAQVALVETQCAKAFMNDAGVRLVDQALTISGGAGFMAKHPLSRMYRDVRAGGFMHPFGKSVAWGLIGEAAMGQPLSLK